jgi:fibronectin type 3 domain-containing protein
MEDLEGRYLDENLQNGVRYTYYMCASNKFGRSIAGNNFAATPSGIPDAPRNLASIEVHGSLKLSWEAPISDNGSPLTGYMVYRSESGSDPIRIGEISVNSLMYIDEIIKGRAFIYTVTAVNANGESVSSNEVDVSSVVH